MHDDTPVVAEGAHAVPGSSMEYEVQLGKYGEIVAGAIGERVATEIQARTGFDTRLTVLGHVQRGGMTADGSVADPGLTPRCGTRSRMRDSIIRTAP